MTKSEHGSEKQASDNEEAKKEKDDLTSKDKKRRPDVLYGKGGNKHSKKIAEILQIK